VSKSTYLLTFMIINAMFILVFVFLAYVPQGSLFSASMLDDIITGSAKQEFSAVQAGAFGQLDPHALAPNDQVAIGLMNEPLIRFDSFLNLDPALAYTWYWQDDIHLVTKLRSDAVFHDFSPLSCADVSASLTRAQQHADSGLRDMFAGVLLSSDEDRVCVFELPQPDHTFLRKLTRLYILPSAILDGSADADEELALFGAGRYQLTEVTERMLTFTVFDDYYDYDTSLPGVVTLTAEPKKYNRLGMMKNDTVDVLLDTPASFVRQIESRLNYNVQEVASFESMFLIYNSSRDHLARRAARVQVSNLIRSIDVESVLADQGLYGLTQFAPSGVFGFSPDLNDVVYAKNISAPDKKVFLTLGVTEANKTVAEILQTKLAEHNIDIEIVTLSADELQAAVQEGTLDIYLLGWRFDLGTVDALFTKLIHSNHGIFGELNGYGYSSREVDSLVEGALAELNTDKRLEMWQKLMDRVVRDDIIGMPLLGIRRLYATKRDTTLFQPRMDGLLIFNSHELN